MQYTKTGLSILATMALTLTGCGGGSSSSSSDGGTPSSAPDTATYTTVDASSTSAWAHMDFSSGSSNATVNDIWQVGFQRYNGMSNSGISATGSGPNADDVSVCVAYKFDGLYDGDGNPVLSEFEKLNLNNTLEAFNSVTKASCASGDYLADTLSTQIKSDDWMEASTPYPTISYQAVTTDNNGWIIQSADGNSYARVKVSDVDITYNGATDHSISPARIKLSSEKWNGASWDAALDSGWLDFEAGAVYWDLETNTTVTQVDQWDLNVQLSGRDFQIRVNGGASGDGNGGVGLVIAGDGYAKDVTDSTATGYSAISQISSYNGDGVSGAFTQVDSNYGFFTYNGTDHKMYPHFTVYLVKDGTDDATAKYYKLQAISYYGETGTGGSGNVYVRYEEVFE